MSLEENDREEVRSLVDFRTGHCTPKYSDLPLSRHEANNTLSI